jgi:hypothetical protein
MPCANSATRYADHRCDNALLRRMGKLARAPDIEEREASRFRRGFLRLAAVVL